MERRKPAAIDRTTALRYMGAAGWTPDDATTALLDKVSGLDDFELICFIVVREGASC